MISVRLVRSSGIGVLITETIPLLLVAVLLPDRVAMLPVIAGAALAEVSAVAVFRLAGEPDKAMVLLKL